MKTLTSPSLKAQSRIRHFLPAVFSLSAVFFIGTVLMVTDYRQRILSWASVEIVQGATSEICKTQHKPYGAEMLPKGIISATSDLEMQPLCGYQTKNSKKLINLLAMAVGIKQKEIIDKIVQKFPPSDFVVMLFHYDGIVDEWKDLEWSDRAIHVSAINQTKWWFAKHFLHPDIVLEYSYIFLWDEDLGVDNFHAGRYLSIIKEEGLEISQPALHPSGSEVYHRITRKNHRLRVHRRTYQMIGRRNCNKNSTGPMCTGFVEMMAPVFSKASWHCTWHMIQNNLIQGWGVNFRLSYCAQGDQTKNVGIVDSEYIIHYGLPTLGGSAANKVRKWPFIELEVVKNRWKNAVNDDELLDGSILTITKVGEMLVLIMWDLVYTCI